MYEFINDFIVILKLYVVNLNKVKLFTANTQTTTFACKKIGLFGIL
jgi:hypothetical protein